MKTIKQLITLTMVLGVFSLFAQKKVALESNGVSSFFTGASPFSDAYNAAVDGDTIYLPGGTFASPNTISKQLTIYGIGHNPDSSLVMGETIITGSFGLNASAANSHFEGLKLTSGSFSFNGIADSIVIKRCYFTSVSFNNHASNGVQIIENVFQGINGSGSLNAVVANNIIKKSSHNVIANFDNQAWFRNNIIVATGTYINYSSRYMFDNITNCLFDNNIIINEGNSINNIISSAVSNNTFMNNVFNAQPSLAINTWQNNFFDIASSTIFITYNGLVFNYTEDFNLQSPATYVGTTGNEVGIYGGFTPAKFGMVPENPHYQLKTIASSTDVNGDLQIQIQVAAQNE